MGVLKTTVEMTTTTLTTTTTTVITTSTTTKRTRKPTRRTTTPTQKTNTSQSTLGFSGEFQFLAQPSGKKPASLNANAASLAAAEKIRDREEKNRKNKKSAKTQDYKYDYEYGKEVGIFDINVYDNYGYDTPMIQQKNLDGFSCWTCSQTYWDPNSSGDLYADCRSQGEYIRCSDHVEDSGSDYFSAPVSCQITERKFFGVVSELHVGCKQTRACQNNFIQNRMMGSVYGRTCRPTSTFGISTCRQCCATDDCFSDSTVLSENFDDESEWFDTANHATLIKV